MFAAMLCCDLLCLCSRLCFATPCDASLCHMCLYIYAIYIYIYICVFSALLSSLFSLLAPLLSSLFSSLFSCLSSSLLLRTKTNCQKLHKQNTWKASHVTCESISSSKVFRNNACQSQCSSHPSLAQAFARPPAHVFFRRRRWTPERLRLLNHDP